jgi:hypothetical protein
MPSCDETIKSLWKPYTDREGGTPSSRAASGAFKPELTGVHYDWEGEYLKCRQAVEKHNAHCS